MPEKRAGGIGEKEGSEESGKVALYSRKGGFLFSERWLRKIGKLAFFDRIMQIPYREPKQVSPRQEKSRDYHVPCEARDLIVTLLLQVIMPRRRANRCFW
jgi:hypothetical protein